MLLLTSCKKEEDKNNDTGNAAPAWLIPYQGTYTGTYDGNDYGTWSLSIANSPQLILETYSEPDDETIWYSGTINPDGSVEFTRLDVVLTGTITDFCQVTGTWHDYAHNGEGTFEGWKEPGSLNSLLKQINNADGDVFRIYAYDNDGRHVKTQYYSNNNPTNYVMRGWQPDEITYTYYLKDGSVAYEYKNPLPLNNMGLSEYATYIRYEENQIRYDTCASGYNQQGYQIKQIRNVTLIPTAGGNIEKGTEIRTYTYINENMTCLQIDYSVGSLTYSDIYNYTYYTEYIDHRNNLSPYLGKISKNLRKQMEVIYTGKSNFDNMISEYSYDFYDIGLVKDEHVIITTASSTYEYHNIHYYK